jgi:3-oxoacyl-[acyl-carrier protein] reductase
VAVVTGASKGIGAEIARQLAAAGASVVVNYSSSKEGADRVVADITSREGKAVAVQANVSKQAEVQRLFAEAKNAFGPVDILVNNAGVYEFSPLEGVTAEHFHKQFDLNVLGLLWATQEAAKQFGDLPHFGWRQLVVQISLNLQLEFVLHLNSSRLRLARRTAILRRA